MAHGEVFAVAQYGPFEWGWLLGGTVGSEEHIYFKWMTESLLETLTARHPLPYYYGSFSKIPPAAEDLISALPGPFPFYDTGVFSDANKTGHLFPLIAELRQKRILYIGPDFLRGLGARGLFSPAGFINVPEVNAYLVRDRVKSDIDAKLLRGVRGQPYDFIGFSAGPLAPVLIHELWAEDVGIPLVDFGSLWDVYFGRVSRDYMKTITLPIRRMNLNAN